MPPKKKANKTTSKGKDQSGKVTYRVFAGGKQMHEVASLKEFMAVAVTNRWLILLKMEKLSDCSSARAWCPFLQPTLLEHGELAKEIKGTNCLDKLVVADMSRPELRLLQESCVQAEIAFVNMLKLVEEEDKGRCIFEGKKNREEESAAAARNIKEDEDIPMLEQQCLEAQTHEEDSSTKESDTKEDLFFGDGKIVYQGKQISTSELLSKLLKGVDNLNTTIVDLKADVKDLKADVKDLKALKADVKDLKADVKDLKVDVKELNKSLSVVAERLSRCSLSLLYAHCSGAKVLYPVTARWMPYDSKFMRTEAMEDLASLYAKRPEDTRSQGPSGLVEIDVLIKITKREGKHRVYTSPMTMKTSRLSSDEGSSFTHVVVGEYARSTTLCAGARAYRHPEHPCRTPSAKLLKKLVQLERGIVATMFYYDAANYPGLVDAAAIVSPSFRQLDDPDSLLWEVLSNTLGALPHVSRLAEEHRLWLIDV